MFQATPPPLSVGADAVARAIAEQIASRRGDVSLIRNGSRGMFWLEPLVEVETPRGRVAYGPVSADTVSGLVRCRISGRASRTRFVSASRKRFRYLKKQERLTFARCGITDPLSLSDYMATAAIAASRKRIKLTPQAIVEEVTNSGLRGRGGAGFPTGIKWRTVLNTEDDQKYIVCNADEGDSGTYADRMIMEGDPFVLIEGMTIAGLAVGATQRLHLPALRISTCVQNPAARN